MRCCGRSSTTPRSVGDLGSCDVCRRTRRSIDMPVHMQIAGIEPGCVTQSGDVRDGQHAITQLDQAVFAQLPDRPVHVDVCKAKEVANLFLSQRERKGDVVLTFIPNADRNLAEQMGDTRMR